MTSLDTWLSQLYSAYTKQQLPSKMEAFKAAFAVDTDLLAAAQQRLQGLNAMIAARGEQACAFSTKYRNFLQEAIAP